MRIILTTVGALRQRLAVVLLAAMAAVAGSGCGAVATGAGTGAGGGAASTRVLVVAAENFWGSLAAQLGGDRVQVVSIVSNPDTDPHSYEPTPDDARSVAQAQYVIVNGAGYDPWAPRLVAAGRSAGRSVLTVADLAGRREGDNPHMWYASSIVAKVVDRIAADLTALDPADAAYFRQQHAAVTETGFKDWNDVLAQIRQRYAGVPVGATESIAVDLAQDAGLDLRTPPGYMRAISEGTDPSAQDKATVDDQVASRQIRVLLFNRQNSTTDVQAIVDRARAAGVAVVPITETLDPPTATFAAWQTAQLHALATALAQATGR